MILTDAEIEELIAMEARATARPWEVSRDGLGNECDVRGLRHDHVGPFDADNMGRACSMCRFIAQSRNALPSLLAEVKAARKVVEAGNRLWHACEIDDNTNKSIKRVNDSMVDYRTALTSYDAAKEDGK